MRSALLEASGKTVDGRTVVRGVYRMHETEGLPLEVILAGISEAGMVPDWLEYLREAVEAGMSEERAISKLDPAIVDSFGPGMRDVVVSRLRHVRIQRP